MKIRSEWKWAAMDEDGLWFLYRNKPRCFNHDWGTSDNACDYSIEDILIFPKVSNWKYSLHHIVDGELVKYEIFKRVKKASEIVKWLEDNGYEPDMHGSWYNKTHLTFANEMFQYCGKIKPDYWQWLSEWLEDE